MATQILITNNALTTGCPDGQCSLQLKVVDPSNLCPNESVKIAINSASTLIWDATYTLNGDPKTPNPVLVGHTELLTGGVVAPGNVVVVAAQKLQNGSQAVCAKEGKFVFELTLLQ